MTSPHASIYQEFVTRATELITGDERFAGLTVGGSWREGRMDEWSDLDLVLVAYPEHQAGILEQRRQIAGQLGDLLSAFTGEHIGDPRVLICLYDAPMLHVDLKFVALADFAVRVEDPVILVDRRGELAEILSRTHGEYPVPDLQWVEDRFWVWVHYAALRLGRGELMELADHLAYLRNACLGSLLLMQYGKSPRRVRRVEFDLPPEAFERLRRTVADYDRQALIEALMASISLYRELREFHRGPDLIVQARAEKRALEFLDEVVKSCG